METLNAEDMLVTLAAAWPAWQVWTVPTWDGHKPGTIWCARRHDNHRVVLNAHEARHLAEYIAEHEQPGSVWG